MHRECKFLETKSIRFTHHQSTTYNSVNIFSDPLGYQQCILIACVRNGFRHFVKIRYLQN